MAQTKAPAALGTQEIRSVIERKIRNGTISPGLRLPLLRNQEEWVELLAARPVNLSALHRALSQLKDMGLIKGLGRGPGGGFVVIGEFEGLPFGQGLDRFWRALGRAEDEVGQVENWYPAGTWSDARSPSPYPGITFDDVPEPMRVPEYPDYLKMASARLAKRVSKKNAPALKWTQIVQDLSHPAPFVRRIMMRRDGEYSDDGGGTIDLIASIKKASIEVSATRNALRTLHAWCQRHATAITFEALETSAWLGTPFIVSARRCLYGHYFLESSSHQTQGEYRCDPSESEPDPLRLKFWQEYQALREAPYTHKMSLEPDDPTELGILFMSEYKDRYETRKA